MDECEPLNHGGGAGNNWASGYSQARLHIGWLFAHRVPASTHLLNYVDRVGGANGDSDLLELIDGRSYNLQ